MATYTEKLGLKLPAQTDFYNIDDFNENFRKIDGSAVLKGTTAPTTATVGIIGQFYLDTESKMLYQCVSAEDGVYGWFNITLDSSIGLSPDVAAALGLTGNPQVKDALNKLKALVDGNTTLANSKAQIVIGSYTGTGTYGVDNPNSLAIPEGAKIFMFLTPWSHPAAYLPQWRFSPNSINVQVLCGTPINLASIPSDYVSIIDGGTQIKKSGNSLYWYNTSNADKQCNLTEVDYHYAFIG